MRGAYVCGGADLTGLAPHRIAARGLVRTFQVARVFGNLSVRENLLVPFLAAGSPGGVLAGSRAAAELLRARHAGAAWPMSPPESSRAASACCCRPARAS